MGDVLTEEDPKERSTFSEIFRKAFPQYLAMGMPADEFWDGDPWLVKPYREAYRVRMENEYRVADRNAWIAGMYIRHALASVPIVVNGFAPKGHHMQDYPDKPLAQQAEENQREEDKKKQGENKQQMAQAMFQMFTEKMNKNILKRLEKEKAGAS